MNLRLLLACLLAVGVARSLAEEPAAAPGAEDRQAAWRKATEVELIAGVNRLADEVSRVAQEVEDERRQLDMAWEDPANTSPEIERLRRELFDIERQLLDKRAALRQAAENLPAIRARREALARATQRRQALREERVFVQQLLRERQQANREQP